VGAGQWVADALLGSPIPPPRWLDPRHAGRGWTSRYGGYFSDTQHVSGKRISEELGELNACVNPPVVQGWAWLLAIAALSVMTFGLLQIRIDAVSGSGILLLVLPFPIWFLAEWLAAFASHDVELRDGEVYLKRWTDVWLGRHGRCVGRLESIHAALSCGNHVQLAKATSVR